MAEGQVYGFDADGIERVMNAVARVEGLPVNLKNPQHAIRANRYDSMVRVINVNSSALGAHGYPATMFLPDATKDPPGYRPTVACWARGPNNEALAAGNNIGYGIGLAADGLIVFIVFEVPSYFYVMGVFGLAELNWTFFPPYNQRGDNPVLARNDSMDLFLDGVFFTHLTFDAPNYGFGFVYPYYWWSDDGNYHRFPDLNHLDTGFDKILWQDGAIFEHFLFSGLTPQVPLMSAPTIPKFVNQSKHKITLVTTAQNGLDADSGTYDEGIVAVGKVNPLTGDIAVFAYQRFVQPTPPFVHPPIGTTIVEVDFTA